MLAPFLVGIGIDQVVCAGLEDVADARDPVASHLDDAQVAGQSGGFDLQRIEGCVELVDIDLNVCLTVQTTFARRVEAQPTQCRRRN